MTGLEDLKSEQIDEVTEPNENQTPLKRSYDLMHENLDLDIPKSVTFEERQSLQNNLIQRDHFSNDITIMIDQTIPVNIFTDVSPTSMSNYSKKKFMTSPKQQKKRVNPMSPSKPVYRYNTKKNSVQPVRYVGT